jgi:hypothetical protein
MSQSSTLTYNLITDKQRQTIVDLAEKAGVEVTIPRTSRVAGKLIYKLAIQAREANGGHDHPTPRQLELLKELGAEANKQYAVPKTRKQATARIALILNARKAAEADPAEVDQEAAVAA